MYVPRQSSTSDLNMLLSAYNRQDKKRNKIKDEGEAVIVDIGGARDVDFKEPAYDKSSYIVNPEPLKEEPDAAEQLVAGVEEAAEAGQVVADYIKEKLDEVKKRRMNMAKDVDEQREALKSMTASMLKYKASPSDSAPRLTKRLVSAMSTFEVRQVLSSADRDIVALRAIARSDDTKAAASAASYIKKLEMFVRRAKRKIEDLDREEDIRARQKKGGAAAKGTKSGLAEKGT